MATLLGLFGLMLCYNTTTMTTQVLDYPNNDQVFIATQEIKDKINSLNLSIYDHQLKDLGLFLCLIPNEK